MTVDGSSPARIDVQAAAERIAGGVRSTPLVRSAGLSALTGAEVLLKLENRQETGSFKLRGAANAVLAAQERARAAGRPGLKGLVAVSTGNHGRAVAHMARRLEIPAEVFVSRHVPDDKLAALRELGAVLHVGGDSQDEAEAAAAAARDERGLHLVHPFDDADVIAGQGTVGREIALEAADPGHDPGHDPGTVLVPLSGGGLLAGVALGLRQAGSAARVVGVAMKGGSAMAASLAAGRPVAVTEVPTLADSLQGGLGLDNRLTLGLVSDLMDELILLDEDAIARGMAFAHREEGQLLEGAGAVGIAALLESPQRFGGQRLAIVASGGNVPLERVLRLAASA